MHRRHRHRLRAFIERHRPGVADEQTAAQPAACARLWKQTVRSGSSLGRGAGTQPATPPPRTSRS
ncbi:hypothetical protein VM98_31295 [Streptomyces rubellomurinus subsp. indigoferus]|nr:hypothetical protein VM98_31295 [Streptomyces rubellomurinus subsp. indigoferus]